MLLVLFVPYFSRIILCLMMSSGKQTCLCLVSFVALTAVYSYLNTRCCLLAALDWAKFLWLTCKLIDFFFYFVKFWCDCASMELPCFFLPDRFLVSSWGHQVCFLLSSIFTSSHRLRTFLLFLSLHGSFLLTFLPTAFLILGLCSLLSVFQRWLIYDFIVL